MLDEAYTHQLNTSLFWAPELGQGPNWMEQARHSQVSVCVWRAWVGLSSCLLGQLLCVAVLSPMLSSCHPVSVESSLQKPVDCPLAVRARVGSMGIQAFLSLSPKLREYCSIETCGVPALQASPSQV